MLLYILQVFPSIKNVYIEFWLLLKVFIILTEDIYNLVVDKSILCYIHIN